ncbi:MAG: lactonase family protein [Microscillaceae bacterium]|nr:lactonase family protein [Microscillaceae bacterium]
MVIIRLDEQGNHQIQNKIAVGISPEGIAISPNGQWIATSNMGSNFIPFELPIFGQRASISLLAFDQNTGHIALKDEQTWEGILPEGISFDADGDMLVSTTFDYLDLSQRKGGIHFWQIVGDKLKNTDFKISLTRGSHFVKIIK